VSSPTRRSRRRGPSGSRAGQIRAAEAAAAEVTPLSQRAAVMMIFRAAAAAVLVALTYLAGVEVPLPPLAVAVGFLAASGALSLGVLVPHRPFALRAFGTSLLLDGVFLQYQHEALGHRLPMDVAIAAELVAVCLLASFRTGLKSALWQSLLLLVGVRAEDSHLFQLAPAMQGVDREQHLLADLALLWLVVGTTAVTTAVNERELRRRRYDAETLAVLATELHGDAEPDAVLTRMLDVVTAELDVPRALVVRSADGRLELTAARGATEAPSAARGATEAPALAVGRAVLPGVPGVPASAPLVPAQRPAAASALLDLALSRDEPVLALRLDPARDPWLDALLPEAARLVVVPVTGSSQRTWLVAELGHRRGGRAQRRVLSSLQQAVATAALAHSRAELLADARRAASTDGLTGVANRRSFDREIDRLDRAQREQGVPYGLVLVDVDHFKSVNDTLGHQAGDEVLQIVAQVLASAARPGDVPARYGGEEFALLLPGADAAVACRVAERARVALHDVWTPIRVSASFGVACAPEDGDTPARVLEAADTALMHAKRTGRDRVVVSGPAVPSPAA
jgi:diguanylate cyclase (GGDEF)-like protein